MDTPYYFFHRAGYRVVCELIRVGIIKDSGQDKSPIKWLLSVIQNLHRPCRL